MPELPSNAEMVAELGRLGRKLDEAIRYLYELAKEYAEKEDTYRLARATLQLEATDQLREKRDLAKPTVDQQRAWVDLHTSKERVEAHLAESLLRAAFEAVKSRRAQLSAVQSTANAVRAEIEMAVQQP